MFRFEYNIFGKDRHDTEAKIKVEETFPISGQGYMVGKLLDDTKCQYS